MSTLLNNIDNIHKFLILLFEFSVDKESILRQKDKLIEKYEKLNLNLV